MLKNTPQSYGLISKSLHWSMAALFIFMFSVAYIMINIPRSGFMFTLYDLHKATGLLLFSLVALRLIWTLSHPRPVMPATITVWQSLLAKSVMVALYLLMFTMPISGFLTSTLGGHDITFYHLFTITALAHNTPASAFFSVVHNYLAYALMFFFSLHVMGALYHHMILKDHVIKRML